MSNRHFNMIGVRRPMRSVFDLSYEKKFTADMGYLYPVMCDEVVPGDVFKIGNSCVIRMQPLVAPIMHKIDVSVHYFFVPYRLLWDDWEIFITGDIDGDDETEFPTWEPLTVDSDEGNLWDYLGYPITDTPGTPRDPEGTRPSMFPRSAYAFIWNEYFRDENVDTELDFDVDNVSVYQLLKRRWQKDYFTSALPWQQRGTSPALPVVTTGDVDFTDVVDYPGGAGLDVKLAQGGYETLHASDSSAYESELVDALNKNVFTASSTAFDVADLRLAFQIQKWMELNARAGVRYTEFLRAHFAVAPRDERLQRPEYIGGSKQPLIISEVLQTSEDGATPQGNLAGHGISAGSKFVGKYAVREFGLIMGLMSIMPEPLYEDGIDRQWIKETRYDFMFPEFVNLSEQPIYQAELYVTHNNETANKTVFGYAGRYDEMRVKRNMICGAMRSDFDYWHISRQFASAPTLNNTFLECTPRKDIFAAPSLDGFIVNFGNHVTAVRPIPRISNPGLIDH